MSLPIGTTLNSGEQNKHCMMHPIVIPFVETKMTSIMVYNMDYRKILISMLLYQLHICGPRMMQNLSQQKHGLIWVYFNLMVEQVHMDI